MAIYSFSPFGYEGALVSVEVDLRRGIPAVDIVGLADGAVKESRERMISAIKNQGFEFPMERVLISLSPADLFKKGAGFDLPIALSVLAQSEEMPRSQDVKVMVLGELELSGKVRPVRCTFAALQRAIEEEIKYAIIPEGSEAVPDGITVKRVKTLREAFDALCNVDEFDDTASDDEIRESQDNGFGKTYNDVEGMSIEFGEVPADDSLDSIKGHNGLKYAMAVAVAGRHNILAYGAPGCGKTLMLQRMPQLMPLLTDEERQSTQRIYSIAGLLSPNQRMEHRPFRMPHQTASIEGMCGGGVNCRPGEISLAHNGVLFLNEAAEFRSSVLQMLRVPLETQQITLARAGRSTVYPARFQLVMATNPCPCGNYGSKDKICLCSAKSVEMYWLKFSGPLLDRISIRFNVEDDEFSGDDYSLENLRRRIKTAWERQYKRQGKLNQDLNPQEVAEFIRLTDNAQNELDDATERYNFSQREHANILKLARTLADMQTENVEEHLSPMFIREAVEIHGKLPIDFE